MLKTATAKGVVQISCERDQNLIVVVSFFYYGLCRVIHPSPVRHNLPIPVLIIFPIRSPIVRPSVRCDFFFFFLLFSQHNRRMYLNLHLSVKLLFQVTVKGNEGISVVGTRLTSGGRPTTADAAYTEQPSQSLPKECISPECCTRGSRGSIRSSWWGCRPALVQWSRGAR